MNFAKKITIIEHFVCVQWWCCGHCLWFWIRPHGFESWVGLPESSSLWGCKLGTRAAEHEGCNWGLHRAVFNHTFSGIIWHSPQKWSHVTSCHVKSCHVTPRYVTSCHVRSRHVNVNVNVTDTILWQGHHDRVIQLKWLYFCGICKMMPLKMWSNTALGCNHQSICMPQLQLLVTSCRVMSRHVTSHPIMSRHVTPCHVMSRRKSRDSHTTNALSTDLFHTQLTQITHNRVCLLSRRVPIPYGINCI